jgi:dipeptide transport system substrate-binding protein
MKTTPNPLLLTLLLWGLTGVAAAQAPAKKTPQKLVYCAEGSPDYFAPSISSSSTSHDAMRPMYERLLRDFRGTTRLIPSLATRWDISPDGLKYTFYLRKGVKWHSNAWFKPSRDFNADDVIFMLERQWKPDHPYHQVTSAKHGFFQSAGLGTLLKSVDKVNEHAVKIELHQPSSSFLFNFVLGFSGIQSQEYAQAMLQQGQPEVVDTHPIGTGPFEFVSYEKDQSIRYRVFDDYWEGRAALDELEFLIVPDANERWKKTQSGECHVMAFPHTEELPAMRQHPEVTVAQIPGINVSYLAMNLKKAPFNDVRVRKAMNMAINKQAILDDVYRGTAVSAVSVIPPTMWSFNEKLKDEPHDPARAKQLLADAGYPNGFSTDLWAMPVERAYNPDPPRMAKLIQADLAKIGVQAEIKIVDWKDYSARMRAGEHTMGLLGWSASHGDPDYFFHHLLTCETASNGGANVSKFCHSAYDQLVNQARRQVLAQRRIPLYEEAQRIFKDQAPWVPIAHSVQTLVFRNEVQKIRLNPFGRLNFYGISMK